MIPTYTIEPRPIFCPLTCNGVAFVPVRDGKAIRWVFVDTADYSRVARYRWRWDARCKGTRTESKIGGRGGKAMMVSLERFIAAKWKSLQEWTPRTSGKLSRRSRDRRDYRAANIIPLNRFAGAPFNRWHKKPKKTRSGSV